MQDIQLYVRLLQTIMECLTKIFIIHDSLEIQDSVYDFISNLGLQNDHKSIMKKIENGLAKVHAVSGCNGEEPSVANRVSDSSNTLIDDEIHTEPFLRVNLVSPGSPAEQAVRINFIQLFFFRLHNKFKLS